MKLLFALSIPGYSLAATAFSVDQNLATIAAVLVATVTLVIAITNWIDKRIDQRITSHAAIMQLKLDNLGAELKAEINKLPGGDKPRRQ